jgi:gas vesicle protein
MATMLKHTMGTVKDLMDSVVESAPGAVNIAKSTMETAKAGTGHAVSSAQSTVMDGVHVVTGIASMLARLTANDALGWIGLSRRRSPFVSLAAFSVGVAAGVGAGLLFAPTSGADLRSALLKNFQGLLGDAKDVARTAEAKVEKIEDKAEKIAGKAKDKAEDLAGKAKDKVEDLAGKANDVAKKVENKAAAATNEVKETYQDAKSMMAAATDPEHATQPTNGTNQPVRMQGSHRLS